MEIEQGLADAYAAGTLGSLAPEGPEVAAWIAQSCRLADELSPEGLALVLSARFPPPPPGRIPPGEPPDPFAPGEDCFAAATSSQAAG